MAMDAKEVANCIRRGLLFSIKTSYRTARGHPSITFILFLLLIIYRTFPSLFAFLVTSSPVIFCTALLLGTLLSYGTPDIPKIGEEEKKTREISSLQVGSTVETFTVETSASTVNVAHEEREESSSEKIMSEERGVCDHGLTVHITKPASDNLVDSSLGSPWQPIDTHDASSCSDSDSLGSSSPDASMADIIPMLDELHPHPQVKEGKHDDNEDVVTWTAEDQKNVMDLGVSEVERNWRLESLAAEWRAGKVQTFETGKNLDFLDSYCDAPMTSVSAPRHDPFDVSYDSVPASAPSVLQPRQNPFDLPHDQVEKTSSLPRDVLVSGDLHDNDVNTSVVVEETGQPIDSFGSLEEEIGEDNLPAGLEVVDTEHVEQERKSFMEIDSVDVKNEQGISDVNLNTSVAVEEACQPTDSFSAAEEEIGAAPASLLLSEAAELEVIEESYEESNSSSSEKDDKISGIAVHEETPNLDEDLLYEGEEDLGSASLASDVKADLLDVASPPKPLEMEVSKASEDAPESAAGATVHSSGFSPLDSESDEVRPIGIDKGTQSEGYRIMDVLSPTSEEPHVSILDLSSIPKENVDDFKFEEVHENTIESAESSVFPPRDDPEMTVYNPKLQVLEAHSLEELDSFFKLHHENPVEPSSSELDVVKETDPQLQVIEAKSIEDIDFALKKLGEGGLRDPGFSEVETNVGLEFLEAKSLEDINLAFKQLSEGSVKNPNPSKLMEHEDEFVDGESSQRFSPLDSESDEVRPIGIDKSTQSEEYRIMNVLSPTSEEPHVSILDLSSIPEVNVDGFKFEEVHANTIQSAESSVFPPRDDPEMTVYNPKLQVLEAHSLEELDAFFKPHHENPVEPSSSVIFDSSEVGASELDVVKETDPQFQVIEAKSIEDIDTNVGLEFLEAKSLEDINLAFKQLSEGSVKNRNPRKLMEHEDEFVDGESSQRHLESEMSDGHQEHELSEVPKETIYEVTDTIMEKIDEKSDGSTTVNVVSDSTDSASRKSRKKVKPAESGSGSSSSSSSSSSDSE